MTSNEGWAIHCHHNKLVEFCYDYEGRAAYIEKWKPANERLIRLKLFKLLPLAAILDIPCAYRKAAEAYQKAAEASQKADEAWLKEVWLKAAEAYQKADEAWLKEVWLKEVGLKVAEAYRKAAEAYQKADEAWYKEEQKAFHAKWCGCKEWNGSKLVFPTNNS